jgi:hypothetical protein
MARKRASSFGQQGYVCSGRKVREDNKADVERVRTSSKRSTDGFLMRALAMAILCFCPPLIDPPFVPTSVSYLSGSQQGKVRLLGPRQGKSRLAVLDILK